MDLNRDQNNTLIKYIFIIYYYSVNKKKKEFIFNYKVDYLKCEIYDHLHPIDSPLCVE